MIPSVLQPVSMRNDARLSAAIEHVADRIEQGVVDLLLKTNIQDVSDRGEVDGNHRETLLQALRHQA